MLNKYFIILNEYAGSGRVKVTWQDIKEILDSKKINYVVYSTQYPQHATELAREIITSLPEKLNFRPIILAIGGDGTLHEVLNGCVNYYRENPNGVPVPLSYIPLGTGNDFARGAGIPNKWLTALTNILNCKSEKLITIGSYTNHFDNSTGYFLNNFGIGFDASIVKVTNHSKVKSNKRTNKFSYILNTLKVFKQFKSFEIDISVDNHTHHFNNAYLATISNHPYFGGGVKILPPASITDNNLDMIIIEKPKFWQLIYLLLTIPFGKHLNAKFVNHFHSSKVNVKTKLPQTIQIDGEDQSNQSLNLTFTTTHYPFWIE